MTMAFVDALKVCVRFFLTFQKQINKPHTSRLSNKYQREREKYYK